MMNGRECYVWEFKNDCDKGTAIDPSCITPPRSEYKGWYRLYADKETGLPVRFHEKGRNIIFDGTHVGGAQTPLLPRIHRSHPDPFPSGS